MAWWNTLADRLFGQAQPAQNAANAGADGAYSAVFPLWEQNAPTYPIPSAWSAAQTGYNKNELVYACIQKRAVSVSEPPLYVYDQPDKKARKRIDNHRVRDLLGRPNPMMGEVDFWQATEIFTNISGFAAWEIEYSNAGDPIGLWPMRPHWCSFLARKGQPVAFVRYQPDGLPAVDVPVDRVLLFMELDPLKPQIRPLSRTSVALRVITSDNAVTDFVTKFFQQGASMAGVLKTQQSLNEAEATRIRSRWRDMHGGLDNWGDIAVLGQGTEFQPTSMTFQEMDFANVDGRDEARICAVFGVPPIIINAKVGLSAATYSNYQQARQAFYEETISPRWQWYESIIDAQLLPKFGGDQRIYPGFDTSAVKALQEDRQLIWERATQAASAGLITRDEARQEMGFDAVDGAGKVFLGNAPDAGGMNPAAPTASALQVMQQEATRLATEPPTASNDAPQVQDTSGKSLRHLVAETKGHDGAMIALYPHSFDAKAIADALRGVKWPEGSTILSPDEYHVTLAYLGDAKGIDGDERRRIVDKASSLWMHNIDSATFNGITRFDGDDKSGDAIVVQLSCPSLVALVAALRNEVGNASDHKFNPHMTLAYIPKDSITPAIPKPFDAIYFPTTACVFADVRINVGDEYVKSIKKALGNWRRDLLAAVKTGAPVAIPDDVPEPFRSAIADGLLAAINTSHGGLTTGDVRAVFERHWPHESAVKAKGVDAPADEADRRKSEREMLAALVAYFDGQLARITEVVKG